jgi:hypothetical protein
MGGQLTGLAMTGKAFLSFAVLASGALAQEVLMDQINLRAYDTARGNAIGGGDVFGGADCYALQLCDDFRTTQSGYILTEASVANLFGVAHQDVTDARVSVYLDLGGVPGEKPVYSDRVSGMRPGPASVQPRFANEHFNDFQFQFDGVLTTITGLWIPLEPDTAYYICIQVDAGPDNWAYTCLDEDNIVGSDCYFRDGPPEEGCDGGWGHTTWRAMGDRYEPANVNYRVVAVGGPPPMPGDFDRDGVVTTADLAAFLQAWRAGEASADLDANGGVETADFLGFLNTWAGH